jgi:hypothetical protein
MGPAFPLARAVLGFKLNNTGIQFYIYIYVYITAKCCCPRCERGSNDVIMHAYEYA